MAGHLATFDTAAATRLFHLNALIALGGEPVGLFDREGRVLVAAPALTRALGQPAEMIENRPIADVGKAAVRFSRTLDRALTEDSQRTVLDADLIPGRELVLTPLRDGNGGPPWGVGVTLVTGAKAEIARFLSSANHDLRQPFQAMQLFHHLLAGRQTDPRSIDCADKLGRSIAAADRGLSVLVQTARLDAGILAPDRKAFPLAMLLIPMIEEFRASACDADLRLKVHFGPAAGDVAVDSDPQLLDILLRNLFDNAIRFTRKGGVLFGVRSRTTGLAVEIWDTGPGIAEADREAIWEDFRRLESPARGGLVGMGLGLGIARRIARRLEHPLTLRSRPGRGSVFSVELPVSP